MNATEPRLLVHEGTFAVLGPSGDVGGPPGWTLPSAQSEGTVPEGLFVRDARHLSRWQLTVDGASPAVLVPASDSNGTAVLTPHGTREEPPAYTVFREQAVVSGEFTERIRLTSNLGEATSARLTLTADADFADQFELRSDHRWYDKPHTVRTHEVHPDGVEFGYRRGEWHSRTTVTAAPPPLAVEETGSSARQLCWQLELAPHGTAELTLTVTAHPHGATDRRESAGTPHGDPAAVGSWLKARTDEFTSAEPVPSRLTDWPELARACEQGLVDLAGLRVAARGPDGEELLIPGAGVPWFLTLFGRDSLLTSLFALPYRPQLAEPTLLALAATQAREEEPERLAQPGKIVHEVRHGELAHFGQVPYGRYYGSVDATPLFLILLGAYSELSREGDAGDDEGQHGRQGPGQAAGPRQPPLARRLEMHARAAVDWMFTHGGLDEHGYLAYHAHQGGLANQNWKDSPGAVCTTDGTRPSGAVMVAEAQGYAYDALRRTAELARTVWQDEAYAERLSKAAAALRERFESDFWMAEENFPLLALDDEGTRADALASNAGHLLWSGILGQEAGEQVGRRLMEEDFFSGWGVRTLAAGQAPYHPLSYHRGSIWPQDNAVIALGLARYGLHEEARTLAAGMVEAAARQNYRLPEVLAGYGRTDHPAPVPYPHACSPQAWAAATPLALLTAVGGAPGT
ncbi:glycogen debranching N-terminal domain-containing protein [Streptomyces sp. WMMB 322]|uniref:amylo-alpha-1,6-glucosidase n=1 Tax=Streptomyces sp. WMMB 322 TaxID=1286821 RepID=UPI00082399EE|nr:glycogen debranching N-terminal domain-containing protein [Streptomyces sp. WMMB 322]SCK39911.1 Glycogen debranching enzyme (alpha-1,6-glucosidase) [Streptomyces sp. WMMB 322]